VSARARPPPPGFVRHLLTLWSLRLTIGLNQAGGRRGALTVVGYLASSAPAVLLGLSFYRLLRWELVAGSELWTRFFLNLLCFVTAAVWTAWPLMSVGVDDHAELSRFAAFPISAWRLLVASTLASLLEPRALVFFAPLIGAAVGMLAERAPGAWPAAVALFLLFALMCAAWSRVALHVVLNVLRQRRSAELIGGSFLVFLFAASFIPPIDTSWLTAAGGDLGAVDEALIANAAVALGRVPPGLFGQGLVWLTRGAWGGYLSAAAGLAGFGAVGLAIAYRLLLRFHAEAGRAGPRPVARPGSNAFAKTQGRLHSLILRDALDLWRNPRARLLAAVPFVLAVLLKVSSARDLVVFARGESADAWLMGALALYAVAVMGSTFAQNAFGYDGQGMAVFLAAPMGLGEVLRARNLVHGAAALGLGLSVSAFYVPYFGAPVGWSLGVSLAAVLALTPVLLCAGNFISVRFPVKFHASLKRRDKLPLVASMLGVAAATVGLWPWLWVLRHSGRAAPGAGEAAAVAAYAVVAWAGYALLLPRAVRALERRREFILQAVARD
jgi:ABC-2 type transport system permease protein